MHYIALKWWSPCCMSIFAVQRQIIPFIALLLLLLMLLLFGRYHTVFCWRKPPLYEQNVIVLRYDVTGIVCDGHCCCYYRYNGTTIASTKNCKVWVPWMEMLSTTLLAYPACLFEKHHASFWVTLFRQLSILTTLRRILEFFRLFI